jgi:putative Holliday junction resolvase
MMSASNASERVGAVDYGERRVGLAVADSLGMLARPLPPIEDASPKRRLARTADALKAEGVTRIIVGLPRNMDGSEGASATAARAFAASLAERLKLPVILQDERLSSVQAGRLLHESGHSARDQKKRVDGAAAAVMLQAWLDARPASGAI